MKYVDTALFLIGQGFKNIWKQKWATLFSILVMTATIFLFGSTYAAMRNIDHLVKKAESNVGMTVFFDTELTEEEILTIGRQISRRDEVSGMVFTDAETAWENFKKIYFEGNEDLAEGFADDNPLAGSASYEIFLNDMEDQDDFAEWLLSVPGVRKVNYSHTAAETLVSLGRVVVTASAVLIAVLLVIAVSLISNCVSLTISMRKNEIHIMRCVGAANGMILCPFLLEGAIVGLIGAGIPVALCLLLYQPVVEKLESAIPLLKTTVDFVPVSSVAAVVIPVGLLLGVGLGLLGSLWSIRKHLKV